MLAAVQAHEITHAVQVGAGRGRDSFDCIPIGAEGHRIGAFDWGLFWNDFGPQRTALERQLNTALRVSETEGELGLCRLVVDQQGYQQQCGLWVP